MSDYKLTTTGVIRAADGAFIPDDMGNRDWQAFQAWQAAGGVPDPYEPPPAPPATILPQDLIAQFTAAEIASIQAAISADSTKALLWYAFLAQRDPMSTANDRFLAGWSALVSILGQARMTAIATALGVTIA